MRAVRIQSFTGPSDVSVSEIPDPDLQTGEVLIDVHACGLAFPDLLLSYGKYQVKPELPFSPGGEIAGVVRYAPEDSGYREGDRVAAFLPNLGGMVERAFVPPSLVLPIPDSVACSTAASLPINYLTAHFALTTRGHLSPDDAVLVHGAGGGLGLACVHLAKTIGARVIAVASTSQKREVAEKMGADYAIDVENFKDRVLEITHDEGVSLVADPVCGDGVLDTLRAMSPEGRWLILGFAGGQIPAIPANRLLLRNVDAVGVLWGPYATARQGFMQRQWADVHAMIESSSIPLIQPQTCDLDDVPAYLTMMENRSLSGKAVALTSTARECC